MSDKYTTVRVPVGEGGFCCLGYVSREQAIRTIRSHAEHDKEEAERILATADDDFVVEQHTGYHVRRNIKVIAP